MTLGLGMGHKNLHSIDETRATLEETPVNIRETDDGKVYSSGTSGCSFSIASSFQQSMVSQISRSQNINTEKPK